MFQVNPTDLTDHENGFKALPGPAKQAFVFISTAAKLPTGHAALDGGRPSGSTLMLSMHVHTRVAVCAGTVWALRHSIC